jgi:hypothetical protein
MIEDYTISLEEDEIYEFEDVWPERIKRIHYPLNGPYTTGGGKNLLSFSPGDLANFPIYDDIKVFHISIYGKADDNDDDREAWADPIRFELLRKLRYKDWNWYISANGWHLDPANPTGYITLEQHVQNIFARSHDVKSIAVRSFPEVSSKMVSGQWVSIIKPCKRTFFEIPYPLIEEVASVIWAETVPGYPIEGYQLPPGSLDILGRWGNEPLDENLFRQVVDSCSIIFYTWPAEHRRFAFMTNKWSLDVMKNMLDIPSLQKVADNIKAQLGK